MTKDCTFTLSMNEGSLSFPAASLCPGHEPSSNGKYQFRPYDAKYQYRVVATLKKDCNHPECIVAHIMES